MADRFGRLRAVAPGELPPPRPASRRRRPGPAVLLVLGYGAVFGGGLWLIRARPPRVSPEAGASRREPGRAPVAAPPAIAPDRAALLAGAGVPAAQRTAYFAKLAGARCTCGCNLPLRDCLERDRTCSRSPEIARRLRASLE